MFSGFLEQTDAEIGRFVKALEDIGEMDNTLFIYIAGDNGTSAEGGFVGMYNEMTYFNGVTEKVEDLIPLIDKWGGPETFPHMAAGWAVAFDTPFTVDQAGGVRLRRHPQRDGDPLAAGHQRTRAACAVSSRTSSTSRRRSSRLPVCRSPSRSTARRRRRSRARVCVYAFNDAKAPERHKTQYFEMFGNRGIYSDGWMARTIHRAPWQTSGMQPLTSDVWELYDVRNDFSLTKNLAGEQAAKLKEMQALFMIGSREVPRAADRRPDHRAHQPGRSRAGRTCSATASRSRSTKACRACSKTPS